VECAASAGSLKGEEARIIPTAPPLFHFPVPGMGGEIIERKKSGQFSEALGSELERGGKKGAFEGGEKKKARKNRSAASLKIFLSLEKKKETGRKEKPIQNSSHPEGAAEKGGGKGKKPKRRQWPEHHSLNFVSPPACKNAKRKRRN